MEVYRRINSYENALNPTCTVVSKIEFVQWNFRFRKNMFCFNMRRRSDKLINRTGGLMVSVLSSNVVDRGFEFRSGQIKDYKIDMCSNSAKHKSLMRKRTKYLSSISTLFCQGNKSTKMYITSVIFKLSEIKYPLLPPHSIIWYKTSA
jgi:hypothetical protein